MITALAISPVLITAERFRLNCHSWRRSSRRMSEEELQYTTMESPVQRLVQSKDIREQGRAISLLLKGRQLHKFSKAPEFSTLINNLAEVANDKSSTDRLTAVALICKLAGLLKNQRPQLAKLISLATREIFPSLDSLEDADSRLYLATFWRYSTPDWASQYLANSAVREDGSEIVRKECIDGLFSTQHSLSSVIHLLRTCLKDLKFATESPAKSSSRRLKRILAALRGSFIGRLKNPGQGAGEELKELLDASFQKLDGPPTLELQEEIAEEVLALLHEIVRTSFVSATDESTYAVFETLKRWFAPGDWERYTEKSVIASFVAHDIEEVLELLVKIGRPDNQLLRFLGIISGSERQARQRALGILSRNPGLSEEIAAWLQGRSIKRKSKLANESQTVRVDEDVSLLLLDSMAIAEMGLQVQRDVLRKMKILGDENTPFIGTFVERVLALTGNIQALATNRSLQMVGEIGAVVEFQPLQHELTDQQDLGATTVLIIRPGVMTQVEDGSYRIVRKALVERA
jgi:hypothetical protein